MSDEVAAPDLRTLTGQAKALAMAERRRAVAELMAKGRTLREIADELGITFGQSTATVRAILREVEKTTKLNAERHRARALAKVLAAQRKAWEMLDRFERGSIEREQAISTGSTTTPSPQAGAMVVKQKSAFAAEAKLLDTIRKLYEDERKILGIEAPEAPPPSTGQGVNIERGIVIVNHAGVTDDDGWLRTIQPGPARQGVGLLPPGTTDAEAEVVQSAEVDARVKIEE